MATKTKSRLSPDECKAALAAQPHEAPADSYDEETLAALLDAGLVYVCDESVIKRYPTDL